MCECKALHSLALAAPLPLALLPHTAHPHRMPSPPADRPRLLPAAAASAVRVLPSRASVAAGRQSSLGGVGSWSEKAATPIAPIETTKNSSFASYGPARTTGSDCVGNAPARTHSSRLQGETRDFVAAEWGGAGAGLGRGGGQGHLGHADEHEYAHEEPRKEEAEDGLLERHERLLPRVVIVVRLVARRPWRALPREGVRIQRLLGLRAGCEGQGEPRVGRGCRSTGCARRRACPPSRQHAPHCSPPLPTSPRGRPPCSAGAGAITSAAAGCGVRPTRSGPADARFKLSRRRREGNGRWRALY